MNNLLMNKEEYYILKRMYEECLKTEKAIFIFQGKEILTAYAKYLLQYLKPKYETT